MKPLYGHTSEETAYYIADYPYGFKLRCEMKVWLETRDKMGVRMVTRTSNPKKPGVWNKPKYSTYAALAGNLFLDEEGHIQWDGLSQYSDIPKMEQFLRMFPENPHKELIEKVIAWRQKREAAKADPSINGQK